MKDLIILKNIYILLLEVDNNNYEYLEIIKMITYKMEYKAK